MCFQFVKFVMAGLVPAIHALHTHRMRKDVDTRHEAEHDGRVSLA
jgi:hypothetical protein